MKLRQRMMVPALVVPDEQTWTVSGSDPATAGIAPAFALGSARRVLLPDSVPDALVEPLRRCLDEMPADAVAGVSAPEAPGHSHGAHHEHGGPGEHGGHSGHGHGSAPGEHDVEAGHHHHEGHDDHEDDGQQGGHDHGDMMAITGEPSADGLIMEPIDVVYGPLATPLPGGLLVEATLDGDVVASASVTALLEASGDSLASPDPLSPVAWSFATPPGRGVIDPWDRVAQVEIERCVSHLAWLRSVGRLLGWSALVDACTDALAGVRRERDEPARARPAAERVVALLRRSRTFRRRATGLAALDRDDARRRRLHGPNARASGLRDDGRNEDPLYQQLGFETAVEAGGDAHARTLVRGREAVHALTLAGAAMAARHDPTPRFEHSVVEGPRGPLHVHGQHRSAAGAPEARLTAAAAMVGREWSAALLAVASFDLSPWRVGE